MLSDVEQKPTRSLQQQADDYRRRFPEAGLPNRGDHWVVLVGREMAHMTAGDGTTLPADVQFELKERSKERVGDGRLLHAIAQDMLQYLTNKVRQPKLRRR